MKLDLEFSDCTYLRLWLKSPVVDPFSFISANPYIMNYMISKKAGTGKYYTLNKNKKIIIKNITSQDYSVSLELGLSFQEVYQCIPKILHKKNQFINQILSNLEFFNESYTNGVFICHPNTHNQYKHYKSSSVCVLMHSKIPVNSVYFVAGGFIIPYNKVMKIAGFGVLSEKIYRIQ